MLSEFILANNIVILNQKIYEFIAAKKIRKNTIYRCNRHCINYSYLEILNIIWINFASFIDKKYYSYDTKTKSKHHVQSSIFRYLNIFNKNFFNKISIKNLKSIMKKIIFILDITKLYVFFFQKNYSLMHVVILHSWIKILGSN